MTTQKMTRADMRAMWKATRTPAEILEAATASGIPLSDALSMLEWEFSLSDDTLWRLSMEHQHGPFHRATRSDLRDYRKDGASYLDLLDYAVSSGVEFPDALHMVASEFKLSARALTALKDAYDNER